MAKTASKIIELAQSWIGKNEKDGSFKAIIDIYNNHKPLARGYKVKYTDEWCATTISALAIKCGYTDIIPTECSCQRMIELLKEKGIWVENENRTPKAGDIIFYDWSDNGSGDNRGWADHVGIVEKVENGNITVIEGNYSSSVKRRTIKVNGKTIRGYGVPKYDAEAAKKPEASKSITEVAKDVIAGKYGAGTARKTNLEKAGYNYAEVQAKVNELLKAKPAANNTAYYSKYNGTSGNIDTIFMTIGVPEKYRGKWTKRVPVALANGISNYSGTMAQNLKLMTLAKNGKLKKA